MERLTMEKEKNYRSLFLSKCDKKNVQAGKKLIWFNLAEYNNEERNGSFFLEVSKKNCSFAPERHPRGAAKCADSHDK